MAYNKYNLQILSNYYRELGDFQGNGLYDNYVEGCFESGGVFRIYPYRNQFYMDVGRGYDYLANVRKLPVEPDDFILHRHDPDVFFKYVDQLLDDYKETPVDKTPEYSGTNINKEES